MSMAFVLALITLVEVKASVLLWRSAENGVNLESIWTSTVETRGLVVALDTLANTSVCTNGTLINVFTDATSAFITGVTCAIVAADCVFTRRMVGTFVVTATFIDVCAVKSITAVTNVTLASVWARHIGTGGIIMTIIVVRISTLVIVSAWETISWVTAVTCTSVRSGDVCTSGISMAVVATIVALVVVNTWHTIASVTIFAGACVGAWNIGTSSIGMTVICILTGALIIVGTPESITSVSVVASAAKWANAVGAYGIGMTWFVGTLVLVITSDTVSNVTNDTGTLEWTWKVGTCGQIIMTVVSLFGTLVNVGTSESAIVRCPACVTRANEWARSVGAFGVRVTWLGLALINIDTWETVSIVSIITCAGESANGILAWSVVGAWGIITLVDILTSD
jgi:hypothetical protein